MDAFNSQELEHMTDASMRALDLPGGEEILERMVEGQMEPWEGLVALLVLSGEYERC